MIHQQLKAERLSRKPRISVRKMAKLMGLQSKNGTICHRLVTKIESGGNVNYSSYVRYAAALNIAFDIKFVPLKK